MRHRYTLEGGIDDTIGRPVVGEIASQPCRIAEDSGDADPDESGVETAVEEVNPFRLK